MNTRCHKTKYIFPFIFASFLLLFFSSASAQTITPINRLAQLQLEADKRARQMDLGVQERRLRADYQNKIYLSALQPKLSQIADIKKQQLVKEILDELTHVNLSWTNHFISVLGQLDNVLSKIKSRQEKALLNGRDVSASTLDFKKAEKAIEAAREQVSNQVSKTYAIDELMIIVTTPEKKITQTNLVNQFRVLLKGLRDSLFTDLSAIRDGSIRDARIAVYSALKSKSQIPGIHAEPR